jgi:hypothetical protein
MTWMVYKSKELYPDGSVHISTFAMANMGPRKLQ